MIEDFDRAVDTALERGEDPEGYLRLKTEERKREVECDDPLHVLLAKCAANLAA